MSLHHDVKTKRASSAFLGLIQPRPFYSKEKYEEIYMSDHIVTDILYIKCKCQETTK